MMRTYGGLHNIVGKGVIDKSFKVWTIDNLLDHEVFRLTVSNANALCRC